ncbi:protein IMPACT [Eurytemora carolleeae]|uniref:protein IMPACT n=1 Tax=Eurytemora carolleeae TaxID=1294199 RepID=UPI000C76B3C9|nr:protein IMPACT [Eurytemora carolleeae]|eukprot:XP_023344929.1 protein IMPACT-like [Eurytemora affinis]
MADPENTARQIEEIEALTSIYENCVQIENEYSYSVKVEEDGTPSVVLSILLSPGYPSRSPPTYTLSAPSFSSEQRISLSLRLDQVYLENLGECLVFLWVEEIRTFLQNLSTNLQGTQSLSSTDSSDDVNSEQICDKLSSFNINSSTSEDVVIVCPTIFTGECFEDRRSIFQGHVAVVTSTLEVHAVINKLYENKKIANATHNMYAYRIHCQDKNSILQDCEDDGESAAGGRMLHLLEILDVKNILVIVSRWYGGIHLGPDRFKHINNAARQVLEQSGLLVQEKSTKKKKK